MARPTLRRLTAPTLALAALMLAVAAPNPALAKPPVKPGPVTNLAMTLTKPTANFQVDATWTAATNATTYAVVLSNATTGTALASANVGTTAWSASVNLTGVTQVRLSVTGQNQRSGPTATITQDVPDLNAPDGTYTTSWVDRTGTITQTALTDDGPVGQITRTVNWGDGSAAEAWPHGATISHLYAADGLYRPTVTLVDGQGNSRVVVVPAIVPGDKTAPTGAFTTTPGKAWQALTPVIVTQTALSDDFSPASYVLRWVNWGDGSAVEPIPAGAVSASHVYATAGSYTPQVVVKDEAGNTGQIAAQGVLVQADTVRPVVKVKVPPKALADEVGSWKKVAGTATDDKGTGVAGVSVRAIEKRATGWYFYKATSKTWAKAATKAKAWKRAKPAVAKLDKAAWTVRLAGLRKGTLFLRPSATDRAGNVSKPSTTKAVLTAS